jgi:hypothetical protein
MQKLLGAKVNIDRHKVHIIFFPPLGGHIGGAIGDKA